MPTRSRSSRHAARSVRGTLNPGLAARHTRRVRRPLAARPAHHSRIPTFLGTLLAVILGVTAVAVGTTGLAAVTTIGYLSADLPDPSRLSGLTFAQPTLVYDRTGKVELARFQREERQVVAYDQVPKLVLDATTTAEDRTFWSNGGFDVAAIMSAIAESASGARERGASTITQQLVRARLLPEDVVAPGADIYLRKAKELIQSARLTDTFPGEQGKQEIITAYLNEIFYGHNAFGIAAAAEIYFGVADLRKLTPAQAALLAALPKSPSSLDPYRYAVPDEQGRLVVPPTAPPVARRDWILSNLSTSRWTRLTPAQLTKALAEPVVLAGDQPLSYKAPHFVWQLRRQLEQILGSTDAVDTGGYRVVTTLDWNAQQLAEKWVTAAAIAPNLSKAKSDKLLKTLKIPKGDLGWIRKLRGKDLHNAALVAMDYRTGDVLAYVGSAGYYRDDLANPEFEPKYDAAGDGARQPGSAWKPVLYSTAFQNHDLTPGSLLLDITTRFSKHQDWTPRDADQLDRGPVLVRKALQYSLNIPAIRALQRTGNQAVADQAERMGIRFPGGKDAFLQAGLAGAIGTVEVRPVDLLSAYGTIANAGVHVPRRMILEIQAPDGSVVYRAPDPAGQEALSPQAAYLVTDILQGNTDPRQNPIWADPLALYNGPNGSRRPAAVKTGTANDARDLATYGYLPAPSDPSLPALAVGIWMGNSDHSYPRARKPATSLTAAAPLWHAFVRDMSKGMPVAQFEPPADGLVQAKIDAWTGGKPGAWTRDTTTEWFIQGTQPGGSDQVDRPGLLYTWQCGSWRVDPVKAELGPSSWNADVANWAARARRGVGVVGPHASRTAFFWGKSSWGGPLIGTCPPPPKPKPKPTPSPTNPPSPPPGGPGNGPGGPPGNGGGPPGGGGGGGNGGGGGGNGGGGTNGWTPGIPPPGGGGGNGGATTTAPATISPNG